MEDPFNNYYLKYIVDQDIISITPVSNKTSNDNLPAIVYLFLIGSRVGLSCWFIHLIVKKVRTCYNPTRITISLSINEIQMDDDEGIIYEMYNDRYESL